jgi:hypothetical protein
MRVVSHEVSGLNETASIPAKEVCAVRRQLFAARQAAKEKYSSISWTQALQRVSMSRHAPVE